MQAALIDPWRPRTCRSHIAHAAIQTLHLMSIQHAVCLLNQGCAPRKAPSPPVLGHHVYPFTHTTCFKVCRISVRSRWLAITSSMSLYAPGISSTTPLSLRQITPSV